MTGNHELHGGLRRLRGADGVDLSPLLNRVSSLDRDHPLRVVVGGLPRTMPFTEFAALVPSLWYLSEVRS